MRKEYASGGLKIRRPLLAFSVVGVAGGLVVVLLACLSLAVNYRALVAIYRDLAIVLELGSSFLENRTEVVYVAAMATFVLFFLPALVYVAVKGLAAVFGGLREIVFPHVPANVPGDYADYDEVARGFRNQALSIYEPASAFLNALFGRNTMFLSPAQRPVVQENGEGLRRRLFSFFVAAGLLALVLWFPAWLTTEAAGNLLSESDAWAFYLAAAESASEALRMPFVGLIILQGVLGGIEFASGAMLSLHGRPGTVSNEGSEYYRGFGHPAQLFTRLPDLAHPLEWDGLPNRVRSFWGETPSPAVSDTGRFEGSLVIERQPRPIGVPGAAAASLLLGAGWFLTSLGTYVFLFQLLPAQIRQLVVGGNTPFLFTPLSVIAVAVLARQAVHNGARFVDQARSLFEAARFSSLGVLIECVGNLSQAEIRVGKSVADSIESSNVMVRSDFTARFWAAELISEAWDLDECRELLALNPTPESRRWIEFFRGEIARLREEGVQPLGVDVASPEVAQIVGANISISGATGRSRLYPGDGEGGPAELADGIAERLASGEPPFLPPSDSGEWKECPDCAEKVRARARKCRFCGYRFDEGEASSA
jgi:hypothetical protein